MNDFISVFDRLPPYSKEAEMCVLACSVMDRETWENCSALMNRDSFFQADHQIVWDAICELYQSKKPVDALLLRELLNARGLLDEIGGTAYLGDILGVVPSYAHGLHYAEIVAERAKLRAIIAASNDALRFAYGGTDRTADEIAAELERSVSSIRDMGSLNTIQDIGAVAARVIEEKKAGISPRLRTGMYDFDQMTGGLPIGGTTMIAGKPGMGKSQLAKQIAYNMGGGFVADQDGMPVGIISIEETASKIATNYISQFGKITNSRIVYNTMNREEMARGEAAAVELAHFKIFVDDAQQKLTSIQRVARRLAKKHGCRVIILDHLHLVDGETDGNREQELSRISSGMKNTWKELGVCGVEVLQMNRGGDREAIPELDNLRGSGSLEADGDLILQLHRQDYYEWKKDPHNFVPDHRLQAFVNKNKDGAVGKFDLWFDGDHQTIRDWPENVP